MMFWDNDAQKKEKAIHRSLFFFLWELRKHSLADYNISSLEADFKT